MPLDQDVADVRRVACREVMQMALPHLCSPVSTVREQVLSLTMTFKTILLRRL